MRDFIATPPPWLELKAPTTAGERIAGLHSGEAAAERRLIDLEQAFDRLKQTDFWVTPKFLAERLIRFRERQLAREREPQ